MDKRDDWKLKKLEIELNTFGTEKNEYKGSIRFQNGEYESFTFKLRPEMAQPFIDVLAEEIVKAAGSLGDRLSVSLGLREGDNANTTD